MTISERIFDLLEKQGKKQNALAEFIGIRKNTVSEWKAKKTSPSSDLLEKIAAFFGVSIDFLVAGKEVASSISATQSNIVSGSNNHAILTIKNGGTHSRELTEIENELLVICAMLDVKRKNELLSFAFGLKDKE